MRKSQMALVGALALIVLAMLAVAVALRVSMPSVQSGDPRRGDTAGASGDRMIERPEVRDFDRVSLTGNWEAVLVQGDDWDVELSYPSGMERHARVRLQDGQLVLEYQRPFIRVFDRHARGRPRAHITMPRLAAAQVIGAARVDLSGFEGRHLELVSAGAVAVTGRDSRYASLDLSLSGAASADLRGLVVTDARVQLAGATRVSLGIDGGTLSGNVTGAGSLRWYGHVSEERLSVAGGATVRQGGGR